MPYMNVFYNNQNCCSRTYAQRHEKQFRVDLTIWRGHRTLHRAPGPGWSQCDQRYGKSVKNGRRKATTSTLTNPLSMFRWHDLTLKLHLMNSGPNARSGRGHRTPLEPTASMRSKVTTKWTAVCLKCQQWQVKRYHFDWIDLLGMFCESKMTRFVTKT